MPVSTTYVQPYKTNRTPIKLLKPEQLTNSSLPILALALKNKLQSLMSYCNCTFQKRAKMVIIKTPKVMEMQKQHPS